jgi:thymidine kinase
MADKVEKVIETKDNKCWVTISYNVNLGDYENVKVETGYSQTIPFNRSPIDLLEEMQDNVASIVIDEAKFLKKQLKKKRSKE